MRLLWWLSAALVSAQPPPTFPGKNWVRQAPAAVKMDPAKLEDAMKYASGADTSFCASVHRFGYLVADKYWSGASYNSSHIIWSVSKCVTAVLIGIAEKEGKLSTTDLMTKYVPEWKGGKSENVTMDQVMRHCSGRYYDPITDFAGPQFVSDQTKYGIDLHQEYPPGTHDQYNEMAYQTLERVLRVATGVSVQDWSNGKLFYPLEFEGNTHWDKESFFIFIPLKYPAVYGGVETSCANLGRFGHLWLNKGKWMNQTIFTEQFYDKALSEPKAPFGPMREYGNWGQHFPGNWSRAEGMGNQFVAFNPQYNLVATRIGWFDSISELFSYNTFMDKVLSSVVTTPEELEEGRKSWVYAHFGAPQN
jgi:CubicO group peptidase (beta-lactamase class C family)